MRASRTSTAARAAWPRAATAHAPRLRILAHRPALWPLGSSHALCTASKQSRHRLSPSGCVGRRRRGAVALARASACVGARYSTVQYVSAHGLDWPGAVALCVSARTGTVRGLRGRRVAFPVPIGLARPDGAAARVRFFLGFPAPFFSFFLSSGEVPAPYSVGMQKDGTRGEQLSGSGFCLVFFSACSHGTISTYRAVASQLATDKSIRLLMCAAPPCYDWNYARSGWGRTTNVLGCKVQATVV